VEDDALKLIKDFMFKGVNAFAEDDSDLHMDGFGSIYGLLLAGGSRLL
jgi:hypothetical protein